MRNPMNSWKLADSTFDPLEIGPNDQKLMLTLLKGGSEHRKYLRMIHVQFDLTLPRYVWSEFDTYHFNTKNSCSTMHKLLTKEKITTDMFSFEEYTQKTMNAIIDDLNVIREEYIDVSTPDKRKIELLRAAKMILPEGYMQKRTVDTNYEELLTIYHQRINHRLPEWHEFCDVLLKELPCFRVFIEILEEEKKRK